MKRPIIFRGKSIENGEWIYGSLILHKNNIAFIHAGDNLISNANYPIQIDFETASQFTGMEDIKTIGVFEGDILRDYVSGVKFEVVFTDYGNFGLKSDNPVWKDNEYETVDPSYVSTTLRIIGNIYGSNKDTGLGGLHKTRTNQ